MNLNLEKLNSQQLKAVEAKDGVYQIVSVAGSGKTEVLTKRVGYMISHHNVFPDEILLLTFSRAAKVEMQDRIGKILPSRITSEITIDTFHSLGFKILKREYSIINNPLAKAFNFGDENGIIPGWAQKSMIENIMKEELNIDLNNKNNLNVLEVIQMISLAKNELIGVKEFILQCMTEKDFQIAEIYKLYEQKKNEDCLIDFDDLLIKLYELFRDNNKILKKYQNKYKYLLIDEAQDNNSAQYKLIKMLAYPHNNIFLVGDDDQSMYKFRGARPDEFVNFSKKYTNTQIINLENNYRSVPKILDIANNLISNNTIRIIKKLVPFKPDPGINDTVTHTVVDDTEEEAKLVVEKIQQSIKHQNRVYNDFAVIYRTNAQSMAFEDEMVKNGIPYIIYGGVSFYERKEIKDMVSYLKLAHNPNDNEAFERVINTPSRYLGKAFMKIIKEEAKKKKCSYYAALKTAKLTPSQHRNSMNYMNIIKGIHEYAQNNSPSFVLDEIINRTQYDEMLKKEIANEEDNDALENIFTLKSALEKYSDVSEFVEFYKQFSSTKKQKTDSVKLMTTHKSKGLQFTIVFGAGMSEGLMPHRFAIESGDPMSIEEERRLAYVLETRAEQEIHIYSPLKFGRKDLEVSRFVMESGLIKS